MSSNAPSYTKKLCLPADAHQGFVDPPPELCEDWLFGWSGLANVILFSVIWNFRGLSVALMFSCHLWFTVWFVSAQLSLINHIWGVFNDNEQCWEPKERRNPKWMMMKMKSNFPLSINKTVFNFKNTLLYKNTLCAAAHPSWLFVC